MRCWEWGVEEWGMRCEECRVGSGGMRNEVWGVWSVEWGVGG